MSEGKSVIIYISCICIIKRMKNYWRNNDVWTTFSYFPFWNFGSSFQLRKTASEMKGSHLFQIKYSSKLSYCSWGGWWKWFFQNFSKWFPKIVIGIATFYLVTKKHNQVSYLDLNKMKTMCHFFTFTSNLDIIFWHICSINLNIFVTTIVSKLWDYLFLFSYIGSGLGYISKHNAWLTLDFHYIFNWLNRIL